jgi:hypothetical protein
MKQSIKVTHQLTAQDINDFFDDRLTLLKIPNYFDSELALRAASWFFSHETPEPWFLDANKSVKTDMDYIFGVPRRVANQRPEMARKYQESSQEFWKKLEQAFGTSATPMHTLIATLREQFPEHFRILDFAGAPGLPAIVRSMTHMSCAEGICHVDSFPNTKQLSANLYLETPVVGGELKIWDIARDELKPESAWYRIITKHAYQEEFVESVQLFLPPPVVVPVAPGDLIIFDTSKPHAVRGVAKGRRIALQTFLRREQEKLVLVS